MSDQHTLKTAKRAKIRKRIRRKLAGTTERPRLAIFRSVKHIYAQLIDDSQGKTLVHISSTADAVKNAVSGSKGKIGVSKAVGMEVAKAAKSKGIEKVVFDRGGYQFHGRVKAVADGAREGGLQF
ncbi:50S ribosomal protein L18 [bacterium]|nr:50S ribosomal protein L18 [bacterium]